MCVRWHHNCSKEAQGLARWQGVYEGHTEPTQGHGRRVARSQHSEPFGGVEGHLWWETRVGTDTEPMGEGERPCPGAGRASL